MAMTVLIIKGHLLMSTPLFYKQRHDLSSFPTPLSISLNKPVYSRFDTPADCSESPNPHPQPTSLFYTTNALKVYLSPPG